MGLGRRATAVGVAMTLGLAVPFVVAGPVSASGATAETRAQQAQAGQWGVAEEQAFVAKINELRTGLGLAPLAVDGELEVQARTWAQTMKDAGNIFHSQNLSGGITSDWAKIGENVGVGGTVDDLFNAFVASPKHYENLVDPSYRFVGIGVVWDGNRMFTTHRFMALLPPEAPTTAPTRTRVAAAPDELASAEPETTTTETPAPIAPSPAAPVPVAPPADPVRIALVLRSLDGLLDRSEEG